MKRELKTISAEQTETVAEKIAQNLRGGEVIELISDLGGGKTTFTRGLARGIGSTDRVASPTFTISKLYKGPSLEIAHFDFYRLGDAGLMEHELHDFLTDPRVVTVVEWGDVVAHVLPDERITVHMKRVDEDSRQLLVTVPENLSYIMEGL
jgi:tRNA threonylcarbamoyladenosine biosynthesis protein TsaE